MTNAAVSGWLVGSGVIGMRLLVVVMPGVWGG